jgi:hypothetical protein
MISISTNRHDQRSPSYRSRHGSAVSPLQEIQRAGTTNGEITHPSRYRPDSALLETQMNPERAFQHACIVTNFRSLAVLNECQALYASIENHAQSDRRTLADFAILLQQQLAARCVARQFCDRRSVSRGTACSRASRLTTKEYMNQRCNHPGEWKV